MVAFEGAITEFTAWEINRENTIQSLHEIQGQVNQMNKDCKDRPWYANAGMSFLHFITLTLFPNVLERKLIFEKDKEVEIAIIIQRDNKITQQLYDKLNASGREGRNQNLSNIKIVVEDIGEVFGGFTKMVENSKPEGELSQYLQEKKKDMINDFGLLKSICVYLVLYKMYASVNSN